MGVYLVLYLSSSLELVLEGVEEVIYLVSLVAQFRVFVDYG